MTSEERDARPNALKEMVTVRFKEFLREPEALFWSFGFPILLAIGLGIAFRSKPAEVVHVAVVRSQPSPPAAPPFAVWPAQDPAAVARRDSVLINSLRKDSLLAVEVLSATAADSALRTGRVAIVVSIDQVGGGFTYQFDDTRPDARNARLVVNDAAQRAFGRRDQVGVTDRQVREVGSRYIDFVVPGLLGMSIMGGGIWGLGFSIVDQRRRKLLKRLVATPMSRAQFLASYLISRLVMLTIEVGVLLGFSILLFGVPMRGSWISIATIIVLSALAFGGLGLLIASRASTIEGASGMMNLAMLPMWVLSGVFFSSENFPNVVQPFIKALPLTATNDALRASMLRGVPLQGMWLEFAVLTAWMVVCFAVALKIFRWR